MSCAQSEDPATSQSLLNGYNSSTSTNLEVGRVLDEVPSSVPLDRRCRVTDHATFEPGHVALGSLNVLE